MDANAICESFFSVYSSTLEIGIMEAKSVNQRVAELEEAQRLIERPTHSNAAVS